MKKFKIDVILRFVQEIEVSADSEEEAVSDFIESTFYFEKMNRESMRYIESYVGNIEEIKEHENV